MATACQGNGSHTAFAGGVLQRIIDDRLDSHSKLDRDPGFVDRLVAHGRERAPALWDE